MQRSCGFAAERLTCQILKSKVVLVGLRLYHMGASSSSIQGKQRGLPSCPASASPCLDCVGLAGSFIQVLVYAPALAAGGTFLEHCSYCKLHRLARGCPPDRIESQSHRESVVMHTTCPSAQEADQGSGSPRAPGPHSCFLVKKKKILKIANHLEIIFY